MASESVPIGDGEKGVVCMKATDGMGTGDGVNDAVNDGVNDDRRCIMMIQKYSKFIFDALKILNEAFLENTLHFYAGSTVAIETSLVSWNDLSTFPSLTRSQNPHFRDGTAPAV
jgi:hypothetical protein